jgi:hypothetical protein
MKRFELVQSRELRVILSSMHQDQDRNQVEDMPNVQSPKQTNAEKRKMALSPELNEFLHMLKALESESNTQPKQAG